jgi:hypothetical protein
MENPGILNKFGYIQMSEDFPIESEPAFPFVIQAVEMAESLNKTVHIQNTSGLTIHIIHPEDRTTN